MRGQLTRYVWDVHSLLANGSGEATRLDESVALETETPHRAVGNNITPELDMRQVVQETILERLGRLQRRHLAVYSIISVWF